MNTELRSFNVRSSLAKLLATENIRVNQTNSRTAWFDVQKRVLNLPLWDVEDHVYDMLVGHEVGHALYTPEAGWHESTVDLRIPRSYINVVEDARIEKLIKRKYPGMVLTFQRAYEWMYQEDFFKIADRNVAKMNLIDRINIHFKLGANVKVPFTATELPFVRMVADCESFEDVVIASKSILAYWKDHKEKEKQALKDLMDKMNITEDMLSDIPSDDDGDSGEYDDTEEGNAPSDTTSNTDESDAAPEGEPDNTEANSTGNKLDEDKRTGLKKSERPTLTPESKSNDTDLDQDKPAESSKSDADEDESDDFDMGDDSFTDNSLRENETRMLSDEKGQLVKLFDEEVAMSAIIGYKEYYKTPRGTNVMRRDIRLPDFSGWNHYDHYEMVRVFKEQSEQSYKKFMLDTNKIVSYMAKEFEQRKAAYQYSRAKVSNSGVLNTSALHKYKFSEDVFKRITTLADAKSHGIVVTIDMSGSMNGRIMFDTVRQALTLAMFCNRVNIPFEMYGYTSGESDGELHKRRTQMLEEHDLSGTIASYGLKVIQFFSHKMKKKEYQDALFQCYMFGCGITNKFDYMGSTPTNEALVVLKYVLKKFKKETSVQKLMNVIISDGDPNRSVAKDCSAYSNGGFILQVSNTKVTKLKNMERDLSHRLLELIAKDTGCINVGYFLGDSSSLRTVVNIAAAGNYNLITKIKSDMRNNGGAIMDNILGYSRYIILKQSELDFDDDITFGTNIVEDASKSVIAREFGKYTKTRRTSRILLDKFVESVA